MAAPKLGEGAAQAVGRDLSVRFLAPEAPVVLARADERRVRQILGNLISNAVKFTASGEVNVSVGTAGDHVFLEVSDTGPGIAEADRATLFELYGQAGDAASKRKGSGLGLFIARKLAEAQGGALSLESELGRGSSFRLLLPRAAVAT